MIKILQKMFQYIIAFFQSFRKKKQTQTFNFKSLFRFVQTHEFKPFKTIFLNLASPFVELSMICSSSSCIHAQLCNSFMISLSVYKAPIVKDS